MLWKISVSKFSHGVYYLVDIFHWVIHSTAFKKSRTR